MNTPNNPTPTIVEALKAICSEFAQTHPLIIAARAALRAEGESREGEDEVEFEQRLIDAERADNLRLIDWIADRIGLPHDQELSQFNFAQWQDAQPHHPTASVEEWVCPKCGAQADERFDCCEVYAETQHYAASIEAVAKHVRSSAREQLVDQARGYLARTWTEQGWRAEQSLDHPGYYDVWTPDSTGQRRIMIARWCTENTAALLCFVSTGMVQLCDLADLALTAQQHPGLGSGGPTEEPDGFGRLQSMFPRLHGKTVDLLNQFVVALAEKLTRAEEKYGYSDGWARDDWEEECRRALARHVQKGDPLDVAAYAAFCWKHMWSTAEYRQLPAITMPRPGPPKTAAERRRSRVATEATDIVTDIVPATTPSAPIPTEDHEQGVRGSEERK